jgi:hypothetical protein
LNIIFSLLTIYSIKKVYPVAEVKEAEQPDEHSFITAHISSVSAVDLCPRVAADRDSRRDRGSLAHSHGVTSM